MSELFPTDEKAAESYQVLIYYCASHRCNEGCIFWRPGSGCRFPEFSPGSWLPLDSWLLDND